MNDYIQTAMDVAKEAGYYLLQHFGKLIESEIKADLSRVTVCDKYVEDMVRKVIIGKWPQHGIIGEEHGVSEPSSEYTWIIDPVDGTHNFIRGIPMYGVSIGLLKASEFCGGVIYMPCADKLYSAEKGSGAYCNGQRIHVSTVDELKDATLLFDSGLRVDPAPKLTFLSNIASKLFNVRMFGASVQNMTMLAEGKGDILIEFDEHLWDFAGGLTIVQEAGGIITDHDNSPITIKSKRFVATNGTLHQKILSYFK
jgi:histidinol phosphatase-like enzyme (inositol monophosphatase family)